MWARIRRLSIAGKLIAIQVATTVVVLVLVVAVFAINDARVVEEQKTSTLTAMARVVGHNGMAALDFMDPDAARDVLASLETDASVRDAAIYDADGQIFATHHVGEGARRFPELIGPPARIVAGHLDVFHPLERDGERLGTVYIRADLDELGERRAQYLRIAALALILGLAVALLLSNMLQRVISQPIRRLVDTIKQISRREEYSLRVDVDASDELGLLSDEFNKMLAIVEARKRTLRENQELLEQAVRERTEELEAEMAERVRAVAARQQEQAQLRAIVDNMLEGLVVLDGAGRIRSMNPAAERMLLTAPNAARGEHMHRFMARDFGGRPEETLDGLDDAIGRVTEWRGRRADGTLFPIEAVVSEFELDGARYLAAGLRDISERRRLDRLKSEFVSTVSHELRTPITSVYGSLKMILGGVVGEVLPKQRSLLEISQRNAERLIRLLNDLLDIQRIEAGMMELVATPLDLERVLTAALDANKGFARQYDVGVALEPLAEPVWVLGDADRIGQIVTNLVSNAVKFSPRGAAVTVRVVRDEEHARIEVEDRGSGIPEDARDRIFGKFQQADASDTRQKGGTGLGLAICKSLVEQHGGEIDFDSAIGEGTRFWFTLPLARSKELQRSEAQAAPA